MKNTRVVNLCSRSVAALLGAALIASLGACGVKQQVDEMHDATVEMNGRTKELNANTGDMKTQMKELSGQTGQMNGKMAGMADRTVELAQVSGEMYNAIRQGDSLLSRRQSMLAVAAAGDASHKASEAGKYFAAFEFQLWSGYGQDTPELRDEVAASAVREFLKDVQEYMEPGQTVAEPLASGDFVNLFGGNIAIKNVRGERQRVLNSLAVAMSFVNPKQEAALKRNPEVKQMTMYSMIQDAFRARVALASGEITSESLPPYVTEVLAEEGVAAFLLQARYNYLGAMALARAAKLREVSLIDKVKMRYGSWDLDLGATNVAEIKTYTRYLKGAIATRDFMDSVGLKPVMDKSLRALFNNMKVSAALAENLNKAEAETMRLREQGLSDSEVSEKAAAEAEFLSFFDEFKQSKDGVSDAKDNKGAEAAKGFVKAEGAKPNAAPKKEVVTGSRGRGAVVVPKTAEAQKVEAPKNGSRGRGAQSAPKAKTETKTENQPETIAKPETKTKTENKANPEPKPAAQAGAPVPTEEEMRLMD